MGNKINANPTKEFFISMLTRDIDVKAAILELIDNSIDGAKRMRPNSDFNGLSIDIKFDENKFVIEDNCGGMGVDIAQNYAFRFGRSKSRPQEAGNFTGIFGIGMKRALFRLGKKFTIESTTVNDFFSMEVDVDEWIKDDSQDWSFNFSNVATKVKNPIEKIGTKITVSNLHEGIKQDFSLKTFYNTLLNYLARYKTLIASSNLKVSVNNVELKTYEESIIQSEIVTPYVHITEVDGVKIKILAGVAPKGTPANAGWYIYCNGRTVVYADKTELTGWGVEVKSYHPSLAYFRGYVFFESNNLDKLPWNTSKTSVDASAKVFLCAKQYMNESAKTIISMYNSCISNSEDAEDVDANILNEADAIKLNYVNLEKLLSKNQEFDIKLDIKPSIEYTNISFKIEKEKADKVNKLIGAKNKKEIGEKLFQYYWEREVCDD